MNFLARLLKSLLVNFTSRKFWMTLVAIYAEWCIYWAVVASLYTIKDQAQITAFVSITQHFQWTVTTILLAYLGVQTAANFSNTAANSIASVVQNSSAFEKRISTEEHLYKCERLDAKDIPEADEV
jgi:hypothetical protein